MDNASIYLDYNATTPLRPEVKAELLDALGEPNNPSSIHSLGRSARRRLEKSRCQIATLINSPPENIIFTSGGTEANNLALKGGQCTDIIVSSVEHEAVLAAAVNAKKISVDKNGIVILSELENVISDINGDCFVSIMWANNETGVIQPIREIVEIASKYGARVHSDAVQALGKIPINFRESGLSMMSISAHKIGGPTGIGALVIADGVELKPTLVGGGQEKGRRSGTENILGAIGFGKAAEVVAQNPAENKRVQNLRDLFETKLSRCFPKVNILSQNVPRLGNTSAIVMPGVLAETQVMSFDLEGICLSAGAACSSGKVKRSHVVEAMKIGDEPATNTIRISLGWDSTELEIDFLVNSWLKIYNRANKKI